MILKDCVMCRLCEDAPKLFYMKEVSLALLP